MKKIFKSHDKIQGILLPAILPGVIHELNNPLGVLLMNVEIIKEEIETSGFKENSEDYESLMETFEDIESSLERLDEIIKALGVVSLYKNFQEKNGYNLNVLIEKALVLYHTRIKKSVEVEVDSSEKYIFITVEAGKLISAIIMVLEILISSTGENIIRIKIKPKGTETYISCKITRNGTDKIENCDTLLEIGKNGFFDIRQIENGFEFLLHPHKQS